MGRRREVSTGQQRNRSSESVAPVGGEALAFPGQGVDPLDLARILRDQVDHVLVERLGSLLGTKDWESLDLTDTRVAQPAVYVAGLVQARKAELDPTVVFGHSLGELTACAYAGAYTDIEGLDLVVRRAELGHAEHEKRPGRMIVVMRLDAPNVEWVRRTVTARGLGILELAVLNGEGQFVLSGDLAATEAALELISDSGGVARPLAIGGGYHSPLMAPAVDPLVTAIEALELRDPRVAFVSCTTQAVIRSRSDIARTLARSLVLPVRWVETMQAVVALGTERAIDAGPSQTLANLAKFSPTMSFRTLSPARGGTPLT